MVITFDDETTMIAFDQEQIARTIASEQRTTSSLQSASDNDLPSLVLESDASSASNISNASSSCWNGTPLNQRKIVTFDFVRMTEERNDEVEDEGGGGENDVSDELLDESTRSFHLLDINDDDTVDADEKTTKASNVSESGAETSSTTTASNKTQDHQAKRVRFGQISLRKFPIQPGDHPDCTMGPPLTICWDHYKEVEVSVEEFEARRPKRREVENLRLGWIERRRMLLRCGYKEAEMEEARKIAKTVRQQRERTASRPLALCKAEEIQQSLFRKLGRTVFPAAKDRNNSVTTKY